MLFRISILLPLVLIIILNTGRGYSQTDVTDIQTFIDSNITRNFLFTNLDNSILSANFLSKLNYINSYKKVNFYLKNYYTSAVTKLSKNYFRDLDNIKTGVGYSFRDDFTGYVSYTGMFYSDDKNIQLKGTSSNMLYLSGVFDKDYNGTLVNAYLNGGFKYEKQIDELNRGPSVGGEMNITGLEMNSYLIDGQLKFLLENLNPRKNTTLLTRISLDKSFSDNLAHNSFDGFFSRIRKDFYFPADITTRQQYNVSNNIEQRTEYIARANDRFDYTISKKVDFYLTLNPYYRDIYKENYYIPSISTAAPSVYDTEIQELNVNSDAALRFDFEPLDAQFRLSYFDRNEKYALIDQGRIAPIFVKQTQDLESSKNNHTTLFKLSSNIYYSLSQKNRLEISGSASIMRYDTPSSDNTDDRDELNYLFYIGHKYDNYKTLQLINSVDVSLYHTVYIFSDKSSNNNWNRIIRFTSRSVFNPFKALKTANTFSVLANYTIYDFEDIISTVKSYSFRQFDFKDSTNLLLSRYFGIDLYGEIKLYERGELNWNAFAERPLDYFEDRIINSSLDYFFTDKIVFSGGYRYYEQRKFNYTNGVRYFVSFIRTHGPVWQIRAYIKNNSYIELVGSYDFYNYDGTSPNSANGNLYINVLWNF